jgi:hypothetical protein
MPATHKLRSCLFAFGRVLGALGWLWALLAVWHWPKAPAWLVAGLTDALTGGTVAWFVKGPRHWRWRGLLIGVLVVRLAWEGNRPSNDRAWVDYNARLPVAEFSWDRVTLRNVRVVGWRTASDYDLRWEERAYDLSGLRTVDFLVSPFAMRGAMAHTFLSFGFADGEYVAVSVEARKEQGETYSPAQGFFRHYETIFAIGDETDVIGLRTGVYRDPVYLFPIKAPPEQVRALFESILHDANALAERPQFYNTALNTCHLRILRHVNSLRAERIGLDWRNYFPGRSDELALELGLLDFDGTVEEARQRFRINERSQMSASSKAWSRQIRAFPPD